jgi:hypothetical protein
MPVSGHPGKGFVVGVLSGPAWVTGGAYGLEASVFTLVVLLIVGAWLLRGVRERALGSLASRTTLTGCAATP